MRKSLLLILFSFYFSFTLTAQKAGQFLADSLEQVLSGNAISEAERVDVLTQLAYEYRNLLPKKAIAYGDQAEKLAKEIRYEKKLGEIYLYQSLAYNFFNDNIKAYEYALLSVKYNEDNKVENMIPYSKIVTLTTNPNISKPVYLNTLANILEEVNSIQDKYWYIVTIGALGNSYRKFPDNNEADSLIQLAYDESKKNNLRTLQMHNRLRLVGLRTMQGKLNEANEMIVETRNYFDSIKDKRLSCEVQSIWSSIYIEKAKAEQNPSFLDSAERCADAGLKGSLEIEYLSQILLSNEQHYTISKEKGDIKSALKYLEEVRIYNDSIFGQSARGRLQGIAIKQRDEINQAQLKIKDSEVARQRVYAYAGLFGVALIGLLLFFVFRNYRNEKKSSAIILQEKHRSEELLLNILPEEMANELKLTGTTKAKAFTMATVMFTDFKGFTTISEKVSAELLVDEIHHCFSAFDKIIANYKIEKIKTIGDAYLCASGLPVPTYTHAPDMLEAAFAIRNYMLERKKEKESKGEIPFELRIGIHTGPVVAGIVGVKKYAYDIWGDTVNVAARMEQNSEAGKINISGSTFELVKDKFACTPRGKIHVKNKGEIDMYFVEEK